MKGSTKNLTAKAPGFEAVAKPQCVTSALVLEGRAPVRFIWHADNHVFHFHQGGPVDAKDLVTASLKRVIDMDHTLIGAADLETDWYAERSAPGLPWRRQRRPMDEID